MLTIIWLHLLILLFICSLQSSLESKTRPRCFWLIAVCTLWPLKFSGGELSFSCFFEKKISTASLLGSGLNIFHWIAQLLVTFRSLILEQFMRKLRYQPTNSPTKCQSVWFWANLDLFLRISPNQVFFSKIWLCHFCIFIVT